jgi:hypothetical protein
VWDLDEPLLRFGEGDIWTIRDACEGTQIFGATGSGKTSGSGRALAEAFLRAGFGGLVLTVKPDEADLWIEYAKRTGRETSLLVFSPSERHKRYWHPRTGEMLRYNFLEHETRRPGEGAGLTENIVLMFSTVLELTERGQGNGRTDEIYWRRAIRQLLRNAIDCLLLAQRRLTLPDLCAVIRSAPQSAQQVRDTDWQGQSHCYRVLQEIAARERAGRLTESQRHAYELTGQFFLGEFATLAEKTRSIVVNTFTGMVDGLLRGPLRELFCSELTVGPEATHRGAVLIVDLPVKEYGEVGQIAQALWKYQWQKATERRAVEGNATRPVFLWVDEAQHFVTTNDMLFQTTARGVRACTVYLTQNYANYQAVLGSGEGRAVTDSLLGNLSTKLWHANGDGTTNQHAAETIGMKWDVVASFSRGPSGNGSPELLFRGREQATTAGGSMQRVFRVDPVEFTRLKTGGPGNGHVVEGIVFKHGRVWKSGASHLRVEFTQR